MHDKKYCKCGDYLHKTGLCSGCIKYPPRCTCPPKEEKECDCQEYKDRGFCVHDLSTKETLEKCDNCGLREGTHPIPECKKFNPSHTQQEGKCECEKPHKEKETFMCEKHGIMQQLGETNLQFSQPTKPWTERFDEKFPNGVYENHIKKFISTLLAQQKATLKESVMKAIPRDKTDNEDLFVEEVSGYNQALEETKQNILKAFN